MRRSRLLFLDDDVPRGHSVLVPFIVTMGVLLFFITMYVNDCPDHGGNCTLPSLGRLSFQPTFDNPLLGPSSSALSKMGGLSSNKLVHSHQLWRPFSCIWLHAGFIHLLVVSLSLLFIGIRLEQEFGWWRVGSIYFLSGIGGSLLSALFIENQVCVGSSGALFGLIGAILSELLPNWALYTKRCATLTTLAFIALLNFIVGVFPHIDNFAHIGGFLFGFLLGFVFLIRPDFDWSHQTVTPPSQILALSSAERHRMYQMFSWAMVILILAVGYLVLMVSAFRGVNANQSCGWCRSFSCAPSSHWNCNEGKDMAVCKFERSDRTLILICEAKPRSQQYSGFYSASAIRQLCAELCSGS